jgi:PAS domain S-box-containing protein
MAQKPTYEELEKRISELKGSELKLINAEKALRDSKARLNAFLDHSPVGMAIWDRDFRYVYVNDILQKINGPSFEEHIGHTIEDVLPKVAHVLRPLFESIISSCEPILNVELSGEVPSKPNEITHYLVSYFPISIIDGKPQYIGGVVVNITERKQAEEALKQSEARYRGVVEDTPVLICRSLPGGEIAFANKNYCDYFGKSSEELAGSNFLELIPEADREAVMDNISSLSPDSPSHTHEHRVIVPGGDIRWQQWTNRGQFNEHGKALSYQSIGEDVTKRKKAEENLRNEFRMRTILLDNIPGCIALILKKGTREIVASNKFAQELGAVPGQTCFGTCAMRDDICPFCLAPELWTTGQSQKVEVEHNGTWYEGIWEPLSEDLYVHYIFDISGRKQAEEEKKRLEIKLRQSQKLEAVGTLAGGIAHDFNNILAAMMGYSELALDTLPDGSETSEDIKQVLKAGYRAKDLVRQILSFSRTETQEEAPVQMSLLLKESLKLLRPAIPATIEIKQDIQDEQDKVLADPVQIQQLIMNLCTNAAQAMEESGGLLQIGLATVELNQEQTRELQELEPGKYQELTISDTGVGMDDQTLSRAFEPFYTTKDVGQGTGMGLSVVHGIVTSHGGAVTASSEPGEGSILTVYLSVYRGEGTAGDSPEEAPPLGGDERILLVDDEEALAATGKAKLQRLGYQVTAATSSVKALESFEKHPDAFDLIITDYTMPEMTGTTLSQKILAIRPDMPIIITTGFSQHLTPEKAKSMGIRRMVMKPLLGDRFARVVREVLDG